MWFTSSFGQDATVIFCQINIIMSALIIFWRDQMTYNMIARHQFNCHGDNNRRCAVIVSNMTRVVRLSVKGAVAQHVDSQCAWEDVRRHWRTYQVQSLSATTQSGCCVWSVCVCFTDYQQSHSAECITSCPRAYLYVQHFRAKEARNYF